MAKARSQSGAWIKRAALYLLFAIGLWCGFELLRMARTPPRDNFTGTTLAGEAWSLEQHRGSGPVVVNFFGLTCPGCREEYPHLVEMEKKYRDRGLNVVILARETPAELKADPIIGKTSLDVIGDGSPVFEKYGIEYIPHTVVFGADGKVLTEIEGFDTSRLDEVDRYLQGLQPMTASR